ncbi:lamin tail domain-containing protein [Kutzneria kofuensis]|uniref:LTD domain-containing protein n=1 Tax=Kutzneria kofuensis TaxID=103725 RepID=A0A7W9NJZ3_9PSEU|nr:lamin tail domain-containing protein [Kutzneria kofuensis]MBB5894683.1 hypothetical protein [Kutzneria kofuensis]
MRRSLTAFITAGIAALSLVTGAASASAAPQETPKAQPSFTVVIDQFATRGPGGQADQYIQLKNTSQAVQDLSNFTVAAAPNSFSIIPLVTIPQGTILQPNEVYLIANVRGWTGPPPNQFYSNTTLPDLVGVGLLAPSNTVIDSAATISNSPFVQGAPAPPLTTNQPLALVRVTNTGNNAVDFQVQNRTPGLPGPDPLI